MSKSDETNKGCVYLLNDLKIARKKIMSAVTDDVAKVQFDPINQPGISNLMQIMSSLSHKSMEDITKEYQGKGYGDFKRGVADIVCETLENIQHDYNEIINSDKINEALEIGTKRAKSIASKKILDVQEKLGIEIK